MNKLIICLSLIALMGCTAYVNITDVKIYKVELSTNRAYKYVYTLRSLQSNSEVYFYSNNKYQIGDVVIPNRE